MTYTPEQIAQHIAQRVAAVGENKSVRIMQQLVADAERMREALERIDDLTGHNMAMSARDEQCINREARAALSTQEKAHE